MDPTLSHEVYNVALRIFAALYILWGVLWGLVAWHYGRASQLSWREQGGLWKECVYDFFRPYAHGWAKMLCKVGILKTDICETEVPVRFTVGHYLRFSIFLGALTPLALIFTLHETDRSKWSLLTFTLIGSLLLLSSMGAAGHLFIAHRMTPWSWTRLVVISTLWILAAPILFHFLNWP